MEYNKMIYKVFKYVHMKWKFVATFNNILDAQIYIKNRKGIFDIEEHRSFD